MPYHFSVDFENDVFNLARYRGLISSIEREANCVGIG